MKKWLVHVDMKDWYEYFNDLAEAQTEAQTLAKMFPTFEVGIYELKTTVMRKK